VEYDLSRLGRTILDEAFQIVRTHEALSRDGRLLDPRSMMWIIRWDGWRDIIASRDFATVADIERRTLFNIPVRVTVDDHPDTPLIQLVMETMLRAPKRPTAPFR
jgi:hypothetical protein